MGKQISIICFPPDEELPTLNVNINMHKQPAIMIAAQIGASGLLIIPRKIEIPKTLVMTAIHMSTII
jgi:hypothetical protein